LDFAFVPEFIAATSLLEPAEVCRTESKPFLTIFGTGMRAACYNCQTRATEYCDFGNKALTTEIEGVLVEGHVGKKEIKGSAPQQ